ncbi:hypothetical protein MA16_Dca024175 [Dendrobium catenatum]|uniref:Uncharacterized protein n=1 Tax=Dendrobium catenatum TaxID=906689 RepID=A0A2I0X5A6_9ASPA|nr:hypothetical protein MA16_Dca024175 [Dendrobium catenatum]
MSQLNHIFHGNQSFKKGHLHDYSNKVMRTSTDVFDRSIGVAHCGVGFVFSPSLCILGFFLVLFLMTSSSSFLVAGSIYCAAPSVPPLVAFLWLLYLVHVLPFWIIQDIVLADQEIVPTDQEIIPDDMIDVGARAGRRDGCKAIVGQLGVGFGSGGSGSSGSERRYSAAGLSSMVEDGNAK